MRATMPCREGHSEFDVRWPWAESDRLATGLTAVLRVRDEAHNLSWVLPALLDTLDEVVLVDNLSTDGTSDAAREVAELAGRADRLRVLSYPFAVSRCGTEHRATPPDSVHSLAHYYNWAFAQARTRYAMKWDGDMVLTPEGAAILRELAWTLQLRPAMVVFPHLPLYVESASVGYVDTKIRSQEPWIHRLAPGFSFQKGFDWEVPSMPPEVERMTLPEGLCVELKWLDCEEFGHWTSLDDADPFRSPRKVRERLVYHALRQGRYAELEHVHRIEAPPGVHVVDHVARTWLPRHAGRLRQP